MNNNNQPAATLKDGAIRVTIWANETPDNMFYAATIERSYKDNNGKWQTSNQLTGTDILKGSRLLAKAYDESVRLKQNANKSVTS